MKPLLFLLIVTMIATNSHAHSGNTDSSGGHNCSQKSVSKGLCNGYHYHSTSAGNVSFTKSKDSNGHHKKTKSAKFTSLEDADMYLHNKLWKIKKSQVNKIKKIYKEVENDLIILKCQGEREMKTFSSDEVVTSTPERLTHYISFNDEYLFSEYNNILMLLGKKVHGKWVNQHPRTSLKVAKNWINWHTLFPLNPLGNIDITKVFDLGITGEAYVESSKYSFEIDRQTGGYYRTDTETFRVENSTFRSFKNEAVTKGMCSVFSDENKF